jgi:hypothetical protein
MTQDELCRRLLLTSEIYQQLQLYAQEITRDNPSRAFLESFASRALKRCAELYALSTPIVLKPYEANPQTPEQAPDNVVPLRTPDPRAEEIVELWDGRRE